MNDRDKLKTMIIMAKAAGVPPDDIDILPSNGWYRINNFKKTPSLLVRCNKIPTVEEAIEHIERIYSLVIKDNKLLE